MSLFINRLYSLSIDNFYKYSFFYFFLLTIKKNSYKIFSNNNMKLSFLYNNSLGKKNSLYVVYSFFPCHFFSLPIICNNVFNSLSNSLNNKLNISYNLILYSYKYYNNSLKKVIFNWCSFFYINKLFCYKKNILNYFYIKSLFIISFFNNYKSIFVKRNNILFL